MITINTTPNTDQGFLKTSIVKSCQYLFVDDSDYVVTKIKGSNYYELIYIKQGSLTYLKRNKEHTLKAGSIIIYKPYTKQHYTLKACLKTEAYILSFNCSNIKELLAPYELKTKEYELEPSVIISNIFKNILVELQKKQEHFINIVDYLFKVLLLSLNRALHQKAKVALITNNAFDDLIVNINANYQKDWKLESMSRICQMSKSNFILAFKKRFNTTPKQYILDLRIAKAKDLLLHTSLTIKEIALIVGFTDQLYFSRYFKNKEQLAPSEWQRLKNQDF